MPDALFEEVVGKALDEILETMFFTSVTRETDTGPGPHAFTAALHFNGSPSGSFALSISKQAACELAADFLGSEEPVSEEQAGEVVRELTNMVCGSVLSCVERSQHFDLTEPELLHAPPDYPLRRTFELENGTVAVLLRTRE